MGFSVSGMLFVVNVIDYHLSSVGSTNSWAKRLLHKFSPGTLIAISADEQTAGRGQFGRKWISPPQQNLLLTLCFTLKETLKPEEIGYLLARSVADCLLKAGFPASIKLPNDLFLHQKKIGGILCETCWSREQQWMVLGLGLNLNMPQDIADQLDQPATSLAIVSGKLQSIQEWRHQIVSQFNSSLEKEELPFKNGLRS